MSKIDVEDLIEESSKAKRFQPRDDLLPTGSTLLNLALSENPYGGWAKGSVANVIGDSHAGKSFLVMQTMAELANNSAYDNYELIYDDAESAMHFDILKLFGQKTVDRICHGDDTRSELIETCFFNLKKLLRGSKSLVYVLDSLDALSSKEEQGKTEAEIGKRDYPDKPRIISEQLKQVTSLVDATDSLVLVVSQTRQNIGVMFGPKKRRSGGDALRFYSTHELWLAVGEHIRKKDRDIGIVARLKISKNKLTGKQRELDLPIIVDYGIDDVGSMVDWMLEEKFWTYKKSDKGKTSTGGSGKKDRGREREEEKKNKAITPIDTGGDFRISCPRDSLVEYLDAPERLDDLRQIVAECWMRVEEEIASKRRPRY